jgi:outer membrane PBP1 activator LpoA protein
MLPAHRTSRAVAAALLAASAAFSCATPQPATPPARPAVQMPIDLRASPPPPQPEAPLPPPVATAPPSLPELPPPPVPLPKTDGPAVTLLLPLDAPEFQPAAEAVQRGFLAAMAAEGRTLEVVTRRTDASDERVLADYDAAIQAGTRLVVGPMTRSGVAALARTNRLAVPTLALNQPEGSVAVPSSLFVFGLAVETEARQSARRAWTDGQRIATVVSAPTPLSRRSRDAFVDEWLALGGHLIEVIEVAPRADPALVTEILDRDPPHFVFLADSGERARQLRPYLGSQMPVYATSQVNTTSDPLKNLDLNGVQFADMPWLLRPDDPAMARYPRPPGLQGDLARFYAVGIDAFRIAAALLDGQRDFEFAGVTGRIAVHGSGLVARRPVGATFRDGRTVALE